MRADQINVCLDDQESMDGMYEPSCTENYYPDDLTELLINDNIISNVNDDLIQYDSSETGSSDGNDK